MLTVLLITSYNILPFRFGNILINEFHTVHLFSGPGNPESPTLAFIDLRAIHDMRRKSLWFSKSRKYNDPVSRMRDKRLRRLRPKDDAEDPYIAALLIGLAQEQRVCDRESARESGPCFRVRPVLQ